MFRSSVKKEKENVPGPVSTFPAEEVKEFKEEEFDVEIDAQAQDVQNALFRKKFADAVDVEEQIARKDLRNKVLAQKGFVNKGLDVSTNARLSQFDRERVYDNMWTETTLNLLESWRKKARDASAAHANAARGARHKNRVLAIPTLFVGAAASALAFFSAGDTCNPDDDGSDSLKYLTAVLTSGLAVLGGVSTLYSFSEKMSQHISAAGGYGALADRIDVIIFLPNALRAHSEVVLTDVALSLQRLVETSPLL